jgi:uncharacterized protein
MRFYTTVALSARKALTPEGFLICYDVPVARVGDLVYYEDELGPGPADNPLVYAEDGSVRVRRGPDEVFRPETLASALGKPLVNEHPDDDVTPDDWSELAIGIILNPRQGEGAEADLFLVDLMVTTAAGIAAINDGKRELSFGYDAHYRVLGKGRAEQFNIVINHVALVEQGRCGPRCAIRDAAPQRQEPLMATAKKGMSLRDRLMKAVWTKDEAGIQAVADELGTTPSADEGAAASGAEAPAGGTGTGTTHVHVHLPGETKDAGADPTAAAAVTPPAAGGDAVAALQARLDKMEPEHQQMLADLMAIKAAVEKLAPAQAETPPGAAAEGDGQAGDDPDEQDVLDEAPEEGGETMVKAKDSAPWSEVWRENVALAEILVPGFKTPTFDAKAKPVRTVDGIHKLRLAVLQRASADPETGALIRAVNGGRPIDFKRATRDSLRSVFRAAAALKGQQNNGALGALETFDEADIAQKPAFDFNAAMAKAYGRK